MRRPNGPIDGSGLPLAPAGGDLGGLLAIILTRTHRLAHTLWHTATLAEEERAVLLDGLFTIEAAARLALRRLPEGIPEPLGSGRDDRAPPSGEA